MVDNQHKKITGYRDLSEGEIALMNEGKALAEQCRVFTDKVRDFHLVDNNGITATHAIDQRWLSIGMTDLQKGFMAVIRSIARPTTF